jgi:hypothetical protein
MTSQQKATKFQQLLAEAAEADEQAYHKPSPRNKRDRDEKTKRVAQFMLKHYASKTASPYDSAPMRISGFEVPLAR